MGGVDLPMTKILKKQLEKSKRGIYSATTSKDSFEITQLTGSSSISSVTSDKEFVYSSHKRKKDQNENSSKRCHLKNLPSALIEQRL